MNYSVVERRVYVGDTPTFCFLLGYVDSLRGTAETCTDLLFLFNLSEPMACDRLS
jgi:hypothetical protein